MHLRLLIIQFLSISILIAGPDDISPWYYNVLPGGSHFYRGDYKDAILFSTAELTLAAAGLLVNDEINQKNDEINVPLLLSQQIYLIDKWAYYQKIQLRDKKKYPGNTVPIQFDSTPLSRLISSPFRKEIILTKFVLAFSLFGIVDGIVSYPSHDKSYKHISSVTAVQTKLDRAQGSLIYESMVFCVSSGAATSEELFFRGMLLPMLDYKFGKSIGLFSSSLIFGSLHLLNPGIDKPFYFFSQAFLAGFIFGQHVQQNNYELSEVIAAHFWYNVISATTTWIINPKENPLGFEIQLNL